MKANELRIGNYVNFGVVNEPIKVLYINPGSTIIAMAQPIQLTEEWLQKLGFELEHEFTNAYKLHTTKHPYDCSNLTYSINEKMLRFSNGQNKGATLIPQIKYVHQLQNLYFALTGEELTLEP